MKIKNFSGKQPATPKERRKKADRDLVKVCLWPLAAALLLILYFVYYTKGAIVMDTSTLILAVILIAFLFCSIPPIKTQVSLRKQVYEETK